MTSLDKNDLPKDSSFRRTAILDSLHALEKEKDFVLCACVMWNDKDLWLIKSTEMTEYQLEIWDPFWSEITQIPHRLVCDRTTTIANFKPSPFLYAFDESHYFIWEPVFTHDGTQLASLLIITKRETGFSENQLEAIASSGRQIGRNLELELIQMRISKMNLLLKEAATWKLRADLGDMVVHEINNPLSVIRSRIEMALNGLDFAEPPIGEIKRYLEKSFEMTNRMGKIIEGVKSLTTEHLKIETRNCLLNSLLEDIELLCEKRLKESGAELKFHITENISIDCNPTQISQILVNLITNASDALKDHAEKKIGVYIYQNEGSIHVDVIDSGPGVPEHYKEKIFDPFFTTKKKTGGTGVGLSFTQKLVQAHGGTLALLRNQNPTTFRVVLPKNL